MAGADRTVSDANPAACRILGRTREELAGSKLDDLFDPSFPVLEAAWEELRDTKNFFVSARLLRADGSPFRAEVSAVGGGDEIGVVLREIEGPEGAARGTTGTPRASGEEYRAMVEGSVDAVAIFDINNTFRYANPAFERLLGYRPEELVGTFVPDVVHPEDLMRGAALVAEVQNSPGPTRVPGEFRYRHKDGHWVYLETSLNNLAEDPDVRGVVAICRDVTDRVRAEEKLRESEERFRLLMQNQPDFIFSPTKRTSFATSALRYSASWGTSPKS